VSELTGRRGQLTIDLALPPITELIARTFDPEEIILFGSCALGRARPDSDIDLMVIGDFREARAERKRLLHGAFNGFAVPVDVQLYTRDEFESEARDPGSFAATVRRQGVRLHP
jgi:uncharacterized protein